MAAGDIGVSPLFESTHRAGLWRRSKGFATETVRLKAPPAFGGALSSVATIPLARTARASLAVLALSGFRS
jgi:hypothetical protein